MKGFTFSIGAIGFHLGLAGTVVSPCRMTWLLQMQHLLLLGIPGGISLLGKQLLIECYMDCVNAFVEGNPS